MGWGCGVLAHVSTGPCWCAEPSGGGAGLRTLGRIQQVFTHVCVHVWMCVRKHKQCSQPGLQAFVW